jgi:hypothetical protein
MISIVDIILDYLSDIGSTPPNPIVAANYFIDEFPEAGIEGVIIRHEAGGAVERRFLDGSYFGQFNFSFYSRYEDKEAGREVLESIKNALDMARIETDTATVTCEVTTVVQFVSSDDKERSIYTFSISAEINSKE